MKFTGYILSFYMALLAIIPCCLFDDCPDDKPGTEQTTEHDEGDEPALPAGRDCGSCSPFFNCEGCSPVTVSVATITFTLLPLPSLRTYSEFLQPFIPEVHYDFWQPPRLG